jgi:hypothetical protein
MSSISRRRVLRGLLNGGAVTVALPFLECFLNGNGDALANGQPMPLRFGTWYWSLGITDQIFTKKFGADYDLQEQNASWRDIKQHVNIYSNLNAVLDGRPAVCHYAGWVAIRTGEAPLNGASYPRESIDVSIADVIGGNTRFRSLQLAATGSQRATMSFRSTDAVNPPEVAPIELYQKIFGPEFQDPNSPNFTPDVGIKTRKSVLSSVMEQSGDFRRTIGAADKARLDEYFTAVRELEGRLALQLEKPAPAPACKIPKETTDVLAPGVEVDLLSKRHNLMTDLMVMAVACDQTRVFNMAYSEGAANTTRSGEPRTHHTITHEEGFNPEVGYQVGPAYFVTRAMESWAYFVRALANFKEGDGSLLDRSLVLANSDHHLAQSHTLTGIPIFTAGSAGGRIKTGLHIDGKAGPVTRVGLTALQTMGVQTGEWGVGSMRTSQAIGEVVA